jgi:hypothetical protein
MLSAAPTRPMPATIMGTIVIGSLGETMTDLDFDSLIASLAEERDPLVLEEIVCHYANAGDAEALKAIQKRELALAADLTEMRSGRFGARWFDIDAAIQLCNRQLALIEKALSATTD